jgi:hypothetical protein
MGIAMGLTLLIGFSVFFNTQAADCIPSPDGLVGWWRAEGNTLDHAGTNNGVPAGNTFYGPGEVGSAFAMDGNGSGVNLGNPTSLQLQTFTIEAWIQRASASAVSAGSDPNDAALVAYGVGGYGLGLLNNGSLYFTRVGVNSVSVPTAITDTSWHHVAVTRTGTAVVFYVDGVSYPAPSYNPIFTFSSSLVIGASGNLTFGFLGSIDELAIYNRALAPDEIGAIYAAGILGKCPVPAAPAIIIQPADQTIFANESATFEAMALGVKPFAYQWFAKGLSIPGATNANLTITNAPLDSAGDYNLVITNSYGSTTSLVAILTVNPPPPCAPAPSGILSWWSADGSTTDIADGNSGTFAGNATFGPGKAGQAFVFDGNRDGVLFGAATNLHLQDFSFEAWIKRTSSTVLSFNGNGNSTLFAVGSSGGIGFYLINNGSLTLGKTQASEVTSTASVTDTNWHHVAVTKQGVNVVFYLDAVAYPALPYDSGGYTFSGPGCIGAWFNPSSQVDNSFYGAIDEPAVYNRMLTATEIQAIYGANLSGKCPLSVPPVIVTQPRSTNILAGASVTLTVAAGGSVPFVYQWRLNGTNLAGATNSALTLTNVQFNQAGNYSVLVTNSVGAIASSNANLTVTLPIPTVRALSTSAMAGVTVTVPISLVANGNENTLGFTLNFSTQRLAYGSVMLGSGAAGATLLLNTSLISTGRLGVAVAFPPQSTFALGTQEVVRVTFNSFPLLGTTPTTTTVSFADQPLLRELTDQQLQPLSANYSNGVLTLSPTVFEGDVSPRTNGNQALTTTDWAQAGRFAARLDFPSAGTEFQRADCAPQSTSGDGQIKVTDWVQVGRYVAGIDSLATVGGPTNEVAATPNNPSVTRHITILNTNVVQGQGVRVSIAFDAQGNENAIGFTVAYDPTAFAFAGATLGGSVSGGSLLLNTSQIVAGRLGVVIGLPPGSSIAAGSSEVLQVIFTSSPVAAGPIPLSLTDQLVTRCVSDVSANELAVSYANGMITVNPANSHPVLNIERAGTNVVLSWPLWAAHYSLQSSGETNGLQGVWTNLPVTRQTNGAAITVTWPISLQHRFFRLSLP